MNYDSNTLRTIFASPFDASRWISLLADVFGAQEGLLAKPQPLPAKPDGDRGFYLGSFTTSDGLSIGLFRFDIASGSVIRRKVSLRALVKPFLAWNHHAALAVFADKDSPIWRFSFICDLDAGATAPKRFTYVFGDAATPHRTPVERFLSLQASREPQKPVSFAAMQDAFSVEALSDQFFREYKEHYEDFVSYVTGKRFVKQGGKWVETETARPHRTLYATFGRDDKRVRDYVKKLLGRLVFLHFLQKKGWLGASAGTWANGDRAFLLHLFEKASPEQQADFLDGVLENLFFNALNTDRTSLGDFFVTKVVGIGKCRIPYLNGGLFERDELDALRVKFPADFFDRLLRFFAEYNFTIDENDPDEAEVGIDPEMLSRIFENLLEDNKDKGAFYTPKEIVGYMCRQSLLAYLTEGKSEKEAVAIETFLDTRDASPLSSALASNLAKKLREVKICDPAIGSGAFPMGLLRELFACRVALGDPNADNPAALKRSIIENNIYGVDIEKGAVDIARLRFWLSLVVDEEEPSPLPNLDFKIMQGNSLVESWKGHDLSHLAERNEQVVETGELPGFPSRPVQLSLFESISDVHRKRLRSLLHDWYSCFDHRKRLQLHGAIREAAETQISTALSIEDGAAYFTFGDLDPSANAEFFLWHLWFAEVFDKGGFDIFIGNPPYIQLQDDHGKLGELYKSCGFETFTRTGDIYCLFYERGWQMLRQGGHLCYITSNKWMRAGYGEATRGFFAKKTNPKLLIDFAGEKIFESATVDTNILLFQKSSKNAGRTISAVGAPECRKDLSVFVKRNATPCAFTTADSWVILSPIEQSIKRKIEAVGKPLKDWDIQINYGIKTGCNEAFIIDEAKRSEILENCRDIAERKRTDALIRPILRGRDIKRYGYEWAGLYLIATHNGYGKTPRINIDNYPAIKKYLDLHWSEISKRSDKGDTPYNLRNCAYMDDFAKPKIVWGEISDRTKFALDANGDFMEEATTFLLTGRSLEYLVCFLNSPLSEYCFSKIGTTTGVGTVRWKKFKLEQLSVPTDNIDEQFFKKRLAEYVRTKDCSILNDINNRIYKICGLSTEEVAFIES